MLTAPSCHWISSDPSAWIFVTCPSALARRSCSLRILSGSVSVTRSPTSNFTRFEVAGCSHFVPSATAGEWQRASATTADSHFVLSATAGGPLKIWLDNTLPLQISSTALFVCTSSFLVSAEPGRSSPMKSQTEPLVDSPRCWQSQMLATGGFATASDFDGLLQVLLLLLPLLDSLSLHSALPLAESEPMGIDTSQMLRYS